MAIIGATLDQSYNHDLTLPDGRKLSDLDRFTLARALIALGIRVDVSTPHYESVARYRKHIEELGKQAEAKWRANPTEVGSP
jgi:hypothetical protein